MDQGTLKKQKKKPIVNMKSTKIWRKWVTCNKVTDLTVLWNAPYSSKYFGWLLKWSFFLWQVHPRLRPLKAPIWHLCMEVCILWASISTHLWSPDAFSNPCTIEPMLVGHDRQSFASYKPNFPKSLFSAWCG